MAAEYIRQSNFYVQDADGNDVELKEIILPFIFEKQKESETIQFANPMFGASGSFEAGNWRIPIQSGVDGDGELVPGERIAIGTPTQDREHILQTRKIPRFTTPIAWYNYDVTKYNSLASFIAAKMSKSLLAVVLLWDRETYTEVSEVVSNDVLRVGQGEFEVDVEAETGFEIYDKITAQHAELEDSTNTEKETGFDKSEFVTIVTPNVYRKLTQAKLVQSAGSETQAREFETGKIATNYLNGVRIVMSKQINKNPNKSFNSILWITMTIGEFGAFARKQRLQPFMERPTLTGGIDNLYILHESSELETQIIFPDYIYIGSSGLAPTVISMKEKTEKAKVIEAKQINKNKKIANKLNIK